MNSNMINSFSLIGNISNINEEKMQSNGKKYKYFTVVQNNKYKNMDGKIVNEPSFFNIKIYENKFKEFDEILKIGNYIQVLGKINLFKDKNNISKATFIGLEINDLNKINLKELDLYDYDWLNDKELEV